MLKFDKVKLMFLPGKGITRQRKVQEFKINGLESSLTKDIELKVLQKSAKTYAIDRGF